MHPEIALKIDASNKDRIYRIRVPFSYYVKTKFWRFGLSYWILKMIWSPYGK